MLIVDNHAGEDGYAGEDGPASKRGHSSDDASCIATLYCNTETLPQELEWTWFQIAVATAMRWLRSRKNDSASSQRAPRHTHCSVHVNRNEAVKSGKRRSSIWLTSVISRRSPQLIQIPNTDLSRLTYQNHVKSHTRQRPLAHGNTVKPFGRLRNRHNEFGSSKDGPSAETSALLIKSMTALWRIWRPAADCLQARSYILRVFQTILKKTA